MINFIAVLLCTLAFGINVVVGDIFWCVIMLVCISLNTPGTIRWFKNKGE